ncbi:HMG-Y-related protein A-like [Iris pallida]|uniref:HMG-Y-related protein A-like n=1 Tax=Iris pallida TaxID=29817 RepID=A0AAX6E4M3_IRIPA|nr:HMG-Y-related protein A-like [Iris pallida]
MVQVALRSLSESEGSSASSISSFIVSAYPSLPPAHSNFLPYYLRKLLLSADIVVTTTTHHHPPRFSLPPPPVAPAAPVVDDAPRGRGRPRKLASIREPSVTTPAAASPVPRGRGRLPRKYVPIQDPSITATDDTNTRPRRNMILHLRRRDGDGAAASPVPGDLRRRDGGVGGDGAAASPVPRGRGRPRKYSPIQDPSITTTGPRPRRNMILHLRRRDGDAGGDGGAGWFLLRAGDDGGRGGSSQPPVEVLPPPAAAALLPPDAGSINNPLRACIGGPSSV